MTPAEQAEAAVTLANWSGLLAHILDQAAETALDDDLARFITACEALRDAATGPLPPVPRWPDASNTGPDPAGSLDAMGGTITSTHDGQVIERAEITGTLRIAHDGVVVRDCVIRSTGRYGVDIDPAVTGTRVERVRLVGTDGERSAGLPPYGAWTAVACDISGYVDGAKMGDACMLFDSWIHDLYRPAGSHVDGIQIRRGKMVTIEGCRIEGPWRASTSAILAQAADGPITDLQIRRCLISGGSYSLYLTEKGYDLSANLSDVVWADDSWLYGPISTKGSPQIGWESCRTDTGRALP